MTSGGVSTFDQAEGILARGEADVVAAARQTLADPDWFRKVRLGHGHLVRRCEFTNYCEGLDQRHKQVTCKLVGSRPASGRPGRQPRERRAAAARSPSWRPPAPTGDLAGRARDGEPGQRVDSVMTTDVGRVGSL